MVRFAVLSVALLVFVIVGLTLLVAALILLTVATLVAVPLYAMARPHLQKRGVTKSPIERLQNLYVEGKIDLLEFERRVARLVHVES